MNKKNIVAMLMRQRELSPNKEEYNIVEEAKKLLLRKKIIIEYPSGGLIAPPIIIDVYAPSHNQKGSLFGIKAANGEYHQILESTRLFLAD